MQLLSCERASLSFTHLGYEEKFHWVQMGNELNVNDNVCFFKKAAGMCKPDIKRKMFRNLYEDTLRYNLIGSQEIKNTRQFPGKKKSLEIMNNDLVSIQLMLASGFYDLLQQQVKHISGDVFTTFSQAKCKPADKQVRT